MPESGAQGWRVTDQRQTTGPNREGLYVDGYMVTFMLAGGQAGSVFVPTAEYTPDQVRAAVTERAAAMVEVSKLTG